MNRGPGSPATGSSIRARDPGSHVIWSGEVDDWHEGDHLRAATIRAGLDYDELSSAVDGDPAHGTRSI